MGKMLIKNSVISGSEFWVWSEYESVWERKREELTDSGHYWEFKRTSSMPFSIPIGTAISLKFLSLIFPFLLFYWPENAMEDFVWTDYPFVGEVLNIWEIFWYLQIFILRNLMSCVIKHYTYWCHLFAWTEILWPRNFSFICSKNSYILLILLRTDWFIKIQIVFCEANK